MTRSGAGGANSAGPQDGVDDADADALLAARLQAEEDALADAALAARLQLEERQSARARASAALAAAAGPSRQRQGNLAMQMRRRVEGALAHVQAFEDARNRSLALAAMPVERLRAEARAAAGDGAPEGTTRDALLRSLAAWFKADFFRWFDAPRGADGAALQASAVSPTAEEAAHGARRVELYGDGTRFARYNDPAKLLETRVGRCGEWANCFCLCARALGFRVRHVHDWTDHVWAEVYSEARGGRWLHVDACENCVDEPLLYERGWGKRLSYVIALSTDGATDVSRRYVRPDTWEEVLGRRTHLMEPILQVRRRPRARGICGASPRVPLPPPPRRLTRPLAPARPSTEHRACCAG